MIFSWDLFINALVSGVLLGGIYCALAVGVTVAFGMLDINNIAHPAFIIAGSYLAWWFNSRLPFPLNDPLLISLLAAPIAYLLGRLIYRAYYYSFERQGGESLQGLAFFFGMLFIVEVGLLLAFGVDYRFVEAPYIGRTIDIGFVSIPLRLLVPMVVGLMITLAIMQFMNRTFLGRAILAVSQDPGALQLVGGSPVRVKEVAFGIAMATAIIAGALLIIIQPIEPSIGREYIGRVFAICVLGGMTSLTGTVIAAMLMGIGESLTTTFWGPSWSPLIAFGILLVTLGVRPQGILGR
jgi:branched-chain amino acid transport system permease protein